MEILKDDILTTRGITSEVRHGGEIAGHALLMDFDGSVTFDRVMEDVKDLPGLTALFESSPGSWHAWNCSIRSLDSTALEMLAAKCDPQHISIGYRRGRWTLRFGAKNRVNASPGYEDDAVEYKSAPELQQWWVNDSPVTQSEPHVNLIAADVGDGDELAADVIERVNERTPGTHGTEYRAEEYLTLTDNAKDELR